jgi:DNA-binding MarR family transcriptional regulator
MSPENNERVSFGEIPPQEIIAGVGIEARKKWEYSLDAGFQIIPNVLFRCQKVLGLEPVDVVILMNITTHWWGKDDLPYPRPSVIANRMNVSTRTVERRLKVLEKTGFLRRLESSKKQGRAVRRIDLSGLVQKLKEVAAANLRLRPTQSSRVIHSQRDD